jgi:GAF domain
MQCPRCQQVNPAHAKFCLECGARLSEITATGGSFSELLAESAALRRSLGESLDQQTATADVLGIISRSPADAQPVFDAIAVNALKLCDAQGAVVVRYDGELLHLVAHHNVNPEAVDRLKRLYPVAPVRNNPMGRAVVDRVVVQVPDLQATEEFSAPIARQFGARGHVSIPLLHQDRAIGAIGISRPTLGPFSDRQIALLKTFADQAVIAIENARQFREQEASNRDLREALERQTAVGQILQAISSSPLISNRRWRPSREAPSAYAARRTPRYSFETGTTSSRVRITVRSASRLRGYGTASRAVPCRVGLSLMHVQPKLVTSHWLMTSSKARRSRNTSACGPLPPYHYSDRGWRSAHY